MSAAQEMECPQASVVGRANPWRSEGDPPADSLVHHLALDAVPPGRLQVSLERRPAARLLDRGYLPRSFGTREDPRRTTCHLIRPSRSFGGEARGCDSNNPSSAAFSDFFSGSLPRWVDPAPEWPGPWPRCAVHGRWRGPGPGPHVKYPMTNHLKSSMKITSTAL